MSEHDKLVKYIRRGLRKGFSDQHLIDLLASHGHDKKMVKNAMSHATGGPQREQARERLKILLGAASIVAVVLVVTLILSYSNQQKQIDILSTQVSLTHEAANEYLLELDMLSQQIDSQDREVAKTIDTLRATDSPEADQAILELEKLHDLINKERKETRDLLLELLQSIIKRGAVDDRGDAVMYISPKNSDEFLEYDDRRSQSK